jgi:hypothetical protein
LITELRTVDVVRPGIGKRYSFLPVDHVDVTGFHTDYAGSPMRPELLDIQIDDRVFWYDEGSRYEARVDELVVEGSVIRVAFTEVRDAPPA